MDEAEALAALARRLLIVAIIGVAACLVILAIDYRLKKGIVTEADQWRREMHGRQQPQPQRPGGDYQRPASPGPVRRGPDMDGVGLHSAAPADEEQANAAPIVAPGDERARPPHRGAIDG